jgi:hypothetical protein
LHDRRVRAGRGAIKSAAMSEHAALVADAFRL